MVEQRAKRAIRRDPKAGRWESGVSRRVVVDRCRAVGRGAGWWVEGELVLGRARRMVQGPAWMRRWWWPQSRIRLSSEVGPPSIQCRMWWAWHIIGGRVQCGKRQCWSRATRAFQIAAVTRRCGAADVEDLGVGAEDGGDDVGVAADPPDGGGGEVVRRSRWSPKPDRLAQVVEVHGQGQPRGGAVGLGQHVGGLQRGGRPRRGRRASGRRGRGGRGRRGRSPGRCRCRGRRPGRRLGWGAASGIRVALIRAASSAEQRPLIQAPPAWSSVMERCRLRWAARSSRSRACSSRRSSPSGSTTVSEAAGELAQLGGVERLGLVEQDLDAAGAEVGVAGQGVDGAFDHLGLGGGEPAVAQRLADRCEQWLVDRGREPHRRGAGALVAAGDGGDEVLGGGPAGGLDGVGGVELADHAELEGVEGGLERLDLGDGVHQLVACLRAAQRVSASPRTWCRIWASSAGTPPAPGCRAARCWLVMSEFKHRALTVSVRVSPCVEGNSQLFSSFSARRATVGLLLRGPVVAEASRLAVLGPV